MPVCPIRTLRTTVPLLTFTLAGTALSLSTISIPLLLSQPSLPTPTLLHLSSRLITTSKTIFRTLIPTLTTVPYLFLAYILPGQRRRYYLVAAALGLVCTEGWRFAFMGGLERMILGRAKQLAVGVVGVKEWEAEEEAMERRETSRGVIDRWGVMNLGRVIMVAASGVAGVWGAGVGR